MSVTINTEWLAAPPANEGTRLALEASGAPWILKQASTTYTLAADLTVDRTAFIIGAANVIFDLGTHTITYDNASPITVANGDFETGSGTSATNWDITNAPSAVLAPVGTTCLWGTQVLKFNAVSSAEYIISDNITIPTAGVEYAATVTPSSPIAMGTDTGNYETVTLSVYDETNDALLGTTSLSNTRGFSVVTLFTPTTTNAVYIKITVTPVAGYPKTVYIDNVTLNHSRNHGVIAGSNWSNMQTWIGSNATIKAACVACSNATIQNGTITQGQSSGHRSLPIWAQGNGININHLTTNSSGNDTGTLDAYWATNIDIQHNVFNSTTTLITNRMDLPTSSMVNLARTTGPIIVNDNAFNDSPGSGINISANNSSSFDSSKTITITNNTIDMEATVGNAFGIAFSYISNFEIGNNTITGHGRGIDMDGAGGVSTVHSTKDGTIHDNNVDVREKSEREYGNTAGSGAGLAFYWRTYDDRGWTNINMYDNVGICRTAGLAAGDRIGAIGMRIITSVSGGVGNSTGVDMWNIIEGNTFKAIVETDDASTYGIAFANDALQPDTSPIIRDNIFESNDVSLQISYNYGGTVSDGYFISNTIRKNTTDGNQSRTYKPCAMGYASWNKSVSGVRFIDMKYENGATSAITLAGTGLKTIDIGWLSTVCILDEDSDPVSGAAIVVKDSSNTTIKSGTTDASGLVSDFVVLEKQVEGTNSLATKTNYNPHTITVDSNDPVSQAITASGTFTISAAPPLATSYTFAGQAAGVWNVATTFTITPVDGSYNGVITPHTTGSGVISPTFLNFAAESAAKTFTVTSDIPGEVQTISVTSVDQLGTDPDPIIHKTNLGAFPNGRII